MLTLNDGRSELWQWDTGRTLNVDADCTQVHFSNKVFGRSIDMNVVDGIAIIPDILLQTDKDLIAWAFVGTAENGYTKISKVFKVNKRNKPADYVFTPPEQTTLEEIKEKIEYLESIQDPDAIKNAVEDYLEQNPVEAPVQSVNGKTGKVDLTAEDVGAISQDKLQEATNEALAQAKASGEFDGKPGAPGQDYVLTPTDKAEIAEMAADLVEIPDSGGNVDQPSVEPADDDMPKVFITGVKPTTKDDVLAEMEYVSKTDRFHAYLEIKCQGSSSMNYPKKNFTIKLYSDEARETKLKKDFKGWNHTSNKFVLKANWIDHSHARNIVSARLWGEIVASRPDYDTLPVEMRNAPNNGAVDGFPVKVYYNGNYEGVYTWNIGKDDWMWGMDENNANHVLLCAEGNTDGNYAETPSNFRALWNGVDGAKPGWSVEVGTNSTTLKNSLNNLIQFVMDNDGDAFRNGIGNYLDIQSAIDYYIFQYEICGLDGLAHNMLLATYDGQLWRCGAYDLDSTFGLWWNGGSFVSATYACPENYQERYSLLWERIEANFSPELKARQAYLRKTVLSYSNIITHFERFMDIIGLDLYAEDLTAYSAIPSGSTNNIKQIRNYIRDRQVYVDAEFAAMSAPIPCTGISLDKSVLTFTAEGSQTLTATVTPYDCTNSVIWVSSDPSVASISVEDNICTVTANANGNTTITVTCGNYSASCSVGVSGIAEPIPCTGISLDKSVLTFDGSGTQTIRATVTPSDTTDKIVWSSSNKSVAMVENGVVTAITSGDAVITAQCGNYTATCSVMVTMPIDYSRNAFANVTWTAGYQYELDGTTKATTNCYMTDKFTLQGCRYELNGSGAYDNRLCVWDENGNLVGTITSVKTLIAKPGYQYAFSAWNPSGIDVENLSLMPVEITGNTVSIDLSALDWKVVGSGSYIEANVTLGITLNAIGNANRMLALGNTRVQNPAGDYIYVLYNESTLLVFQFGTDVEAAKAYFTENNTTLILNP